MSHFTTLSVQVKKPRIAEQVAREFGWRAEHVAEFKNPFLYTKESVQNCTVYRDAAGKPKLVVDSKGNVIHDDWSMGREAFHFLQKYTEKYIRATAAEEGAQVIDKGVDANGCRVLEIAYAY